jgi:hypothetical protein
MRGNGCAGAPVRLGMFGLNAWREERRIEEEERAARR